MPIIYSAGGHNIKDGQYIYTGDLLALEEISLAGRPQAHESPVSGFLPLEDWAPFLDQHPDARFAAFIKRGITNRFRIGFNRSSALKKPQTNFQSVTRNPSVVDRYIENELSTGRLARLERSAARKNPIGIIPKPLQPGKFWLFIDLSSPVGRSINDEIDRNLCSLQYISVDQAARLVAACGKGALMTKTDLCSAYRQVPVHRDNQHLLGIEWRGQTYIDKALPFGLRSAPKISTAVADSLAWALHCSGVSNSIHYLDDFLFWGPAGSPACGEALSVATSLCARLGLPTAPSKTVGPVTCLTFLGIEIDSCSQQLRLPAAKLTRLH